MWGEFHVFQICNWTEKADSRDSRGQKEKNTCLRYVLLGSNRRGEGANYDPGGGEKPKNVFYVKKSGRWDE